MKKICVTPQMTDAQAAQLKGKMLNSSYVKLVIGGKSTTAVTADGQVLAVLIKDALPSTLCAMAKPFFLQAATQNVIGSFRGTASGTTLVPAIKKDGAVGKVPKVPDVPRLRDSKHGLLGFMDGGTNNLNPCRTTAYTRDHWEQFSTTVMPYARAVDQVFHTYLPERWAAQNSVAMTTPDYTIAGTAFSTITANANFVTATHKDAGDLAEGFGVITCFRWRLLGREPGLSQVWPRSECRHG